MQQMKRLFFKPNNFAGKLNRFSDIRLINKSMDKCYSIYNATGPYNPPDTKSFAYSFSPSKYGDNSSMFHLSK